MADTKVSGLAGAAAFAPSTTQEFPINDAGTSHKVSAAQIAAYFPNGTQGSAWYAQVTANQSGITTLVDLAGLTVTVTVGTGRRIRVSAQFSCSTTVANDDFEVLIQEGATVLNYTDVTLVLTGRSFSGNVSVILTPTPGSHTYKLTAQRAVGTGSETLNAGATQPAFILVEDLGT